MSRRRYEPRSRSRPPGSRPRLLCQSRFARTGSGNGRCLFVYGRVPVFWLEINDGLVEKETPCCCVWLIDYFFKNSTKQCRRIKGRFMENIFRPNWIKVFLLYSMSSVNSQNTFNCTYYCERSIFKNTNIDSWVKIPCLKVGNKNSRFLGYNF